jgi:uncharacterized secreted protein with C-terminal beta-propeller domain
MEPIKIIIGLGAVILLFFGSLSALQFPDPVEVDQVDNSSLKTFSSCSELKSYIEKQSRNEVPYFANQVFAAMDGAKAVSAPARAESAGSADSYSGTNVQVKGVDEADIVKTDGKYIYVIGSDKLSILDAYPAENAKLLSQTRLDNTATGMFIHDDRLVIFQNDGWKESSMIVFDIMDRQKPSIVEEYYVDGYYVDSRMIGEDVYLIASKPAYHLLEDVDARPYAARKVDEDASGDSVCGFEEVRYFDGTAAESLTTILSLNLKNLKVSDKVFLTGSTDEMYVSKNSIYLSSEKYLPAKEPVPEPLLEDLGVKIVTAGISRDIGQIMPSPVGSAGTLIRKLSLDSGDVSYSGEATVPGRLLNQFSMDEHKGYLRIATTSGHVARTADRTSSSNNLYVLDSSMEVVGKVENLAPGEKIYSARFMGEKGYLVTFRKVDPLFVIDLSVPENPKVLGKLKIPGYSDYLHPYDENHIIGLGKEAIPAENGDFSWYQGVKLSLFDVSDPENPKEISVATIGDRGTDSPALHDHRAFLFDKEKNLLVIPILLAEIDESDYANAISPSMHGEYTFQGAYVFDVSSEEGFGLRGRISHLDESSDELEKSGYYFGSANSVKRSLYIEDILYTVSDGLIKMNDLDNLELKGEVELS